MKRKAQRTLPALAAICSVSGISGTAYALELGDITIESSLGQPLRASIPYSLNTNEQLYDYCISLRPGTLSEGVPTISRPRITVADGRITLIGDTPILEPVMAMQISVDCPYTAHLAREFFLMINPAMTSADAVADPLPQAPAAEPAQMSAPVAERSQPAPVAVTTERAASTSQAAPAQQVAAPAPVATSKPTPIIPAPAPVAEQQPPAETPAQSGAPIPMNSRYYVQAGDTLSSIARRIPERPVNVWAAVATLHTANPHAFVDGDRNQLNANTWIDIPDLSGDFVAAAPPAETQTYDPEITLPDTDAGGYEAFDAPDSGAEAPAETSEVVEASQPAEPAVADTVTDAAATEPTDVANTVAEPAAAAPAPVEETSIAESQAGEPAAIDQAPLEEVPVDDLTAADQGPVEELVTESNTANIVDDTDVLRPGDIIPDTAAPAAQAPVAAGEVPVVSSVRTDTADSSGIPQWMMLAGGSILALLLAVFAFGRHIREFIASRREPEPMLPDAEFDDDEPTTEARIIDDVDFQFDENTLNSQSIALDADLGEGTGLQDSTDLDVAQDFGFSATATGDHSNDFDLELPPEAAAEPVETPTDIIEPAHRPEDALVAEVTPAAEDTQSAETLDGSEEYDLSMIVDATKQELGNEELTAKDLHAVAVEEAPVPQDLANQTLTSEVDIAILEQDYQDEFTQTQALNDEIARAAEELALQMHDENTAEVTSRLQGIDDPAMTAMVDPSAEAVNDDDPTEIASLDDTGVNPQVTANIPSPGAEPTVEMPPPGAEPTVEMPLPGAEPTVEMTPPGADPTVEMPNPGSEPTVEMASPGNDPTVEVEAGQVDTKKPQAS